MSKSIPLSKKYGVNPTIPICFWCGEEKNEIALLGKLKGDAEAPKSTWILGDYEPCDECKSKWEKGIRIVEASHIPLTDKQPPYLQKDAYPTGNIMVITEDGAKKIFSEEVIDKILEKKCVLVDEKTMRELYRIFSGKEDGDNE